MNWVKGVGNFADLTIDELQMTNFYKEIYEMTNEGILFGFKIL
jgi:hypothetical protein